MSTATTKRYGLWGENSHDFLTWHGLVITHTDRAELEFLIAGATVREVPPSIRPQESIPVPALPQFASTRFPLVRSDFR